MPESSASCARASPLAGGFTGKPTSVSGVPVSVAEVVDGTCASSPPPAPSGGAGGVAVGVVAGTSAESAPFAAALCGAGALASSDSGGGLSAGSLPTQAAAARSVATPSVTTRDRRLRVAVVRFRIGRWFRRGCRCRCRVRRGGSRCCRRRRGCRRPSRRGVGRRRRCRRACRRRCFPTACRRGRHRAGRRAQCPPWRVSFWVTPAGVFA